jgi:hypothetical protein
LHPHPGCFAERVWICLIVKELTFLGAPLSRLRVKKSEQQYARTGVSRFPGWNIEGWEVKDPHTPEATQIINKIKALREKQFVKP